MKDPVKKRYIRKALYIVAVFAAIYSCKYLIDAFAFMLLNLNATLKSLTDAAGRIVGIFAIVVIGFVIAYILDPIVTFFQKKLSFSRSSSVSLLYILIFILLAVSVLILLKKLSAYDSDITNAVYIAYTQYKAKFTGIYQKLMLFARRYDYFNIISSLSSYLDIEIDCIKTAQCIGQWLVNGMLSLVIAFYFLKDKKHILHTLDRISGIIIPQKALDIIKPAVKDIHAVFSGYIHGQLTDAIIMSVLISSALSIMKVPFAVPIGIISGIANIIPYFGALMGLLLASVTALISGSIFKALAVAGVMLLLQQIDGLVIVPRVVGEKVSLSPVMVIISLGIAGNLFGIWGMVFAVPVTALIKIFAQRMLKKIMRHKAEERVEN